MKITYFINGETRTASPLTDDDIRLLMGIIERAGGYVLSATVIRSES